MSLATEQEFDGSAPLELDRFMSDQIQQLVQRHQDEMQELDEQVANSMAHVARLNQALQDSQQQRTEAVQRAHQLEQELNDERTLRLTLEQQVELLKHSLESKSLGQKENTPLIKDSGRSRVSMSSTDSNTSNQRGRFGFSTGPRTSILGSDPSATPARPKSSLSHHSNIPAPASAISKRRRSSSISGIPVSSIAVNTSSAAAAAAAAVVARPSTSSASLDKEILTLKAKLSSAENALTNLEKEKALQFETLQQQLTQAQIETRELKQHLVDEQDTLKSTMTQSIAELEHERDELVDEVENLKRELEMKEDELDERDHQLINVKDELLKVEQGKQELERAAVSSSNMNENARTLAEQTLQDVQSQLNQVREQSMVDINELRDEKAQLELNVMKLEDELQSLAQVTSELEQVRNNLMIAEDELTRHRMTIEEQRRAMIKERTDSQQHLETIESSHVIQIESERERMQFKISQLDDKLVEAKREIEALTIDDGTQNEKANKTQAELEEAQHLVIELRERVADLETSMAALQEQKQALEDTVARFEYERASWADTKPELEEQKDELDEHRSRIDSISHERDQLLSSVNELKEALVTASANVDQSDSAFNSKLEQLETERANLVGKVSILESSVSLITLERDSLQLQLSHLESLSSARDTLQDQLAQQAEDFEALNAAHQDAQLKITALETMLDNHSTLQNQVEDLKEAMQVQEGQDGIEIRKLQSELNDMIDQLQQANVDQEILMEQIQIEQIQVNKLENEIELIKETTESEILNALEENNQVRKELIELRKIKSGVQELQDALTESEVKAEDLRQQMIDMGTDVDALRKLASSKTPSLNHIQEGGIDVQQAEVLVVRLRAERDDLRSQLDFARMESNVQIETLKHQVEKFDMSRQELERQHVSAFDETIESGETHRRVLEQKLVEVQDDLEKARQQLLDMEQRLENHDELSRDAQTLARELAAESTKVEELERQLERQRVEKVQNFDVKERCAQLEAQVEELQGRIDRRTEQIGKQEYLITSLRNKLAIVDENDDDTVEIDAIATTTATRNIDDVRVQAELEATSDNAFNNLKLELQSANARLEQLENQLKTALDERATSEDDLAEAREIVMEAEQRESKMQQQLDDLIASKSQLESEMESKRHEIQQLEHHSNDIEHELEQVQSQLEIAIQRHADISSELESSKASFEALRPTLNAMEGRLEDFAQEKSSLRSLVAEKEEQIQQFEKEMKNRNSVEQETTEVFKEVEGLRQANVELENRLQATQAQFEQQVSELTTSRDEATAKVDSLNSVVASLGEQLAQVDTQTNSLQAALDIAKQELADAPTQQAFNVAQQTIETLQSDLSQARTDLHEVLEALDVQEQAARAELDDLTQTLKAVVSEKDRLSIELREAQVLVQQMDDKVQQFASTNEVVDSLQRTLEQTRHEMNNLVVQLDQERNKVERAQKETQELVEVEREAVARVQAALDAAMRENKTLRSLARTAESDVEVLKSEMSKLDQVAALLEQDKRELTNKLQETMRKSHDDIREVLDSMQQVEQLKDEADKRVQELETALASASASARNDNLIRELEDQIKEMSNQLENKEAEVEETEERYMEVLKAQKRYLAQIEKLKAKVSSLQRDLTAAKANPAPAVDIVLAPTTPSSNGALHQVAATSTSRKRRAPTEFEPLTSSTNPSQQPRAIIAAVSRTPSAMKENEQITQSSAVRSSVKRSSTTYTSDGLVPLKPAAADFAVSPLRSVLQDVGSNGVTDGGNSKVADLKRRLAAQQNNRLLSTVSM
ncbi:hypothetical protein OIO90_002575 [Microbotryomycetes sp. JL221]|nr:hypothetical protein OIO90_002575 [Microbotryomycetes sp. JL221]